MPKEHRNYYDSKKQYELTKDGIAKKFRTNGMKKKRIADLKAKIEGNERQIYAINQKMKRQNLELGILESIVGDEKESRSADD